MIELLIVVSVLALMAGIAVSLLSPGSSSHAVADAARRIAADVEFARADALAHRSSRTVVFDPPSETYGVHAGAPPLWHPVTNTPYVVDIRSLYGGVDLETASFGGEEKLQFDGGGKPAAGGEIVLRGGSAIWRVRVEPGTGRVTTHEG